MKRILLLFGLLVSGLCARAQTDYPRQWELLSRSNDPTVQLALLDDWERHDPDNLQMLAEQFRIRLPAAFSTATEISLVPVEHAIHELRDTTGRTTGWVYQRLACDTTILRHACGYIDRAIALAPSRLDLRAGKCNALAAGGSLCADELVETLTAMIDHDAAIDGAWTDAEGDRTDRSPESFRSTVQQYCAALFSLTPPATDAVRRIAQRMLERYPKSALFLGDLGTAAFVEGKYAEAERWYRKALKYTPRDVQLLRNCAVVSHKLGKTKQAIGYAGKMKRYGTPEDAAWADALIASAEQKR